MALLLVIAAGGCAAGETGGPDLGDPGDGGGAEPDLASADPGDGGGGDPGDGGGGEPLFPTAAGTVLVVETRAPWGAAGEVTASFFAGEEVRFQREAQRAGACRLLLFQPAPCDEPCSGVCVDVNVCEPFPSRISAGRLALSGLKTALVLDPMFANFYFADPPPPADLFDPGAAVSVTTSGGDFGAARVEAVGVAPLEVTSLQNDEIRIDDGSDFTFRWKPGADPKARVRLTLNANNRGHGAPFMGIIECDSDDSGSVTISRDLITAFPDTFRWEICAGSDCPLSYALRYTRGEVRIGKRTAALVVGSRRSFWVRHRL